MVTAQRCAHLQQVPWQVKYFVAWRLVVSVGACGQRDECLLSASAMREKRACDPVPRIGLFHADELGGLGLL